MKTKVAPAELAAATLFLVWQGWENQPDAVPMLIRNSGCDQETVLRELYCLTFWGGCGGVIQGAGEELKAQRVLAAMHLLQRAVLDAPAESGAESDDQNVKAF